MTATGELPTLLRLSVILEDDRVRILDRRVFPADVKWLDCFTYEDVARAIEQMVTQSAGPFFAASAGLVLAARAAQADADAQCRLAFMRAAAARMVGTRPTNNGIRDVVGRVLAAIETEGSEPDFPASVQQLVEDIWLERRTMNQRIGKSLASLIGDGETILTHCWPESGLLEMVAELQAASKSIRAFCTETRPYLQGARLTAHSLAEMGIDVTVITDGMAAHAMSQGMISRLVTSADRVTLSGHVINKIGTLQLAIAAQRYGVPYVAMVARPDRHAPTPNAVEMEDRDGAEVLQCLGQRTASPLVKGWYPVFDVTPPDLVAAFATTEGVFLAQDLGQRFSDSTPKETFDAIR